MTFGQLLRMIDMKLLFSLPVSLLGKLADGKLTKEELEELKQELIAAVLLVVNDLADKHNIPRL